MQQFVNVTLSGLTEGMIYSAFALALVLIWRSTRIVNFAQGSMAAATTFIALAIINAGAVLLGGAARGPGRRLRHGRDRRAGHHPAGRGRPGAQRGDRDPGPVRRASRRSIAIIAGSSFQSFPTPFGVRGFTIGDTTIALTPTSLYIIGSVLVVMGLLVALFRFTRVGLAMRASAFGQEVARLLGVRVGRMLTLGWALAAVVGSLSGLLIAGGEFVYPAYMDSLIVFGFVAAVLGGLDSPVGAIVGGLILGLALSYVAGYVDRGSSLVNVAALVILMVVLLVRPGGLFASSAARRA